ncbi:MAG: DUF3276 family protein [Bacteroidota bacterium]
MSALFSKTLKAGKTTYFFDVKEAKNKAKYLTITASQPSTSGEKKFVKRSINVFGNNAEKFNDALKEAMSNLR